MYILISFAELGCFFIVLLDREDRLIRGAFRFSAWHILDKYYQIVSNWVSMLSPCSLPTTLSRQVDIEYHIGKSIFCHEYGIDRSFHFEIYSVKVFEVQQEDYLL